MVSRKIGFVSTRFSGTDGVSLESLKWAEVLSEAGHQVFWFSGCSDRNPVCSHVVERAFFGHPDNQAIDEKLWKQPTRDRNTSDQIRSLRASLREALRHFVDDFEIDVLILQNCNTIPMHLPLGLATAEIIAEAGIPAIAHHHDFHWERDRFMVHGVSDHLDAAFPPSLPQLRHVVINCAARHQLARRKGLNSTIIPNVFQFEKPPAPCSAGKQIALRQHYGIPEDARVFLQPTRIVPRKGIEHAIRLVNLLKCENDILVVSHEAGDEGLQYQQDLRDFADNQKIDLRFIETDSGNNQSMDELWKIYNCADFVTYPSIIEGFGNAFLEAIYFRKPLLINRYSVFIRDIEPLGFKLATMDGYATSRTADAVELLLSDAGYREKVLDHNYKVASRHFGYDVLRGRLLPLVDEM